MFHICNIFCLKLLASKLAIVRHLVFYTCYIRIRRDVHKKRRCYWKGNVDVENIDAYETIYRCCVDVFLYYGTLLWNMKKPFTCISKHFFALYQYLYIEVLRFFIKNLKSFLNSNFEKKITLTPNQINRLTCHFQLFTYQWNALHKYCTYKLQFISYTLNELRLVCRTIHKWRWKNLFMKHRPWRTMYHRCQQF